MRRAHWPLTGPAPCESRATPSLTTFLHSICTLCLGYLTPTRPLKPLEPSFKIPDIHLMTQGSWSLPPVFPLSHKYSPQGFTTCLSLITSRERPPQAPTSVRTSHLSSDYVSDNLPAVFTSDIMKQNLAFSSIAYIIWKLYHPLSHPS